MADDASKPADTPVAGDWFRGRLAMLIVLISLVLTAILAGVAIYLNKDSAERIFHGVITVCDWKSLNPE